MKSEKVIQNKIDQLQESVRKVEKLIIKTNDIQVRKHYIEAKESVNEDIKTLEWVIK
jgi:hypothetical protein